MFGYFIKDCALSHNLYLLNDSIPLELVYFTSPHLSHFSFVRAVRLSTPLAPTFFTFSLALV